MTIDAKKVKINGITYEVVAIIGISAYGLHLRVRKAPNTPAIEYLIPKDLLPAHKYRNHVITVGKDTHIGAKLFIV